MLINNPEKQSNQTVDLSGTSLEVQWLGLSAFTAMAPGSIPGWGTKILQAVRHGQKKKSGLIKL